MDPLLRLPPPPRDDDFLEVKVKLIAILKEKGFEGNTLGEMIVGLLARNKDLAKKLGKISTERSTK